MICFQISIFEPLKTTSLITGVVNRGLWFAFKLVSLNHWKQRLLFRKPERKVVICFQISIFEPLKTTNRCQRNLNFRLWFAFKLVSLNHWKQLLYWWTAREYVVICFQISIFEPLKTTIMAEKKQPIPLWFAFKLVSLNHWKQLNQRRKQTMLRCDLLSN